MHTGTILLVIGLALLAYGLSYSVDLLGRSRFVDLTGPLALGAGVVLGAYGSWLRSRARGVHRPGPWGQVPSAPWAAPVAAGLILCLVALSLFWAVGNYALWRGQDLAQVVAETYLDRPGVVVYAPHRLALQGVTETRTGRSWATRVRLSVQRHAAAGPGGEHLLRHAGRLGESPRLILLKDSADIRIELTYGQ